MGLRDLLFPECGRCLRRVKFCVCAGKRASGDRLKDQAKPLTGEGTRRKRATSELSTAEHNARVRAQGYRVR